MISDQLEIPGPLMAYKDARPSQVQLDFWSSRYVLFVENLSVSFDGIELLELLNVCQRHNLTISQ